jgi:hypothetical protein
MKFQKGISGNPEGRKKGSPNRTTEQMRTMVQGFIETNWTKIQKDFDKLEPSERLKFLSSLLKHVLPAPLNEFENLSDEDLNKIITELKNMGYDTFSKD